MFPHPPAFAELRHSEQGEGWGLVVLGRKGRQRNDDESGWVGGLKMVGIFAGGILKRFHIKSNESFSDSTACYILQS
jgi:hypothetical protein